MRSKGKKHTQFDPGVSPAALLREPLLLKEGGGGEEGDGEADRASPPSGPHHAHFAAAQVRVAVRTRHKISHVLCDPCVYIALPDQPGA